MEPFDPGNGSLAPPPESYVTDNTRFKNSRLSASSLASLLSANHEYKKERKGRKRTEKFSKNRQALQELRTAERRRAYFRDTHHRQEIVFGPEVRVFFLTHFHTSFSARNQIKLLQVWIVVEPCALLGRIYGRLLLRLYPVHADAVAAPARRHLVRPDALLGWPACPFHVL